MTPEQLASMAALNREMEVMIEQSIKTIVNMSKQNKRKRKYK